MMAAARRTTAVAMALALAGAGARGASDLQRDAGIPVLIYHEIVTDPARAAGETVIALDRFEAQMRHLASDGWQTLSIDELVAVMRNERPAPAKAVVLTFDDGWKSVLNALPVLERHRMRASFWIITGAGIGNDYLEWSDVERLANNPRFEFGSHTVSHPWDAKDNLVTWMHAGTPGKDRAAVRAELADSKATLEAKTRRRIDYLAWPVGWYSDEMVELAKEVGYRALLTAEDGGNAPGGDVFRIRRVFVDGACSLESFRRILVAPVYQPCQTNGRATFGHTPPTD